MNPFFFGTSRRPLYGVYHPARGAAARPTGVVLCPPMGQEYIRTHRAFRQLATQLSKQGFHVLRFDYGNTGDSGGVAEDGRPLEWVQDIGTAIEELADSAGTKRVALVGIRLGALLAATAAHAREDVDALVLWDPVDDGAEYVREVLAPAFAWAGLPPADEPAAAFGEPFGAAGFPFPAAMRDELRAMAMDRVAPLRAKRTLLVVSEERPEYVALRDRLAAGGGVTWRHIPSAGDWDDMDRLGASLLPGAILQGITSFLSEETPR